MSHLFARLVNIFNELQESGVEVRSITFGSYDVPIDWDDDTRTWVYVQPCPYTHSHTRHWCGYEQCRDS